MEHTGHDYRRNENTGVAQGVARGILRVDWQLAEDRLLFCVASAYPMFKRLAAAFFVGTRNALTRLHEKANGCPLTAINLHIHKGRIADKINA